MFRRRGDELPSMPLRPPFEVREFLACEIGNIHLFCQSIKGALAPFPSQTKITERNVVSARLNAGATEREC